MIRIVSGKLVFAKKGVNYDYSSIQYDFPGDLAKRIIKWGKKVCLIVYRQLRIAL